MTKRSRHKRTSVRDMVDASSELQPDFFGDAFDTSDTADTDDDDSSEHDARVVVGTMRDIAVGPSAQAMRPVWFLCDENESLVGLVDRYPEGPMPSQLIDRLMTGLREFATANANDLQILLGPTNRLRYGFHTSAQLDEVVESFEDDGFDVLFGIQNAKVILPDE